MWSADRFGDYPSVPEIIAAHYERCSRSGSFFPLTFVDDDDNVMGHLILRYTDEARTELRLGFVIVDSSLRGQGLGRLLLEHVIDFARQELGNVDLHLTSRPERVAANELYRSLGFEKRETNAYVLRIREGK